MSQHASDMIINPPNSSQQGGSITAMETTPNHAGPTGDMQFSIPLPVSKGRGFAPGLTLQYQSSQGNGAFGVGWQLPLLSIYLYTKHGVPAYDGQDRYVGPQGQVLEPERDGSGEIVVTTTKQFGDKTIAAHNVVRYQSRVSHGYERYERWQLSTDVAQTFWLVFGNNGALHCLGKTALAQTSDKGRIAEWSIEESVSPQGEHIRYMYKTENDDHIDTTQPPENTRYRGALSHLTHVFYANVTPEPHLYAWEDNWPDDLTGWLFSVIIDYGERSLDTSAPPSWAPVNTWSARQDPFSDYRYGFEVRCHRLCRQALLFHHFPDELGADTTLAHRLLFCYDENPILTQLTGVQSWAYGPDNTAESRPELNLSYQPFDTPDSAHWRELPPTPGINEAPFYQLVDLYGEGLPGVLYQQGKDWRYRAPIRGSNGDDAIDYSDWASVPQVPALQDGTQMLTDLTGDGRLDWAVIQPGLNGFFTLASDHTWQTFTPFSAVPGELLSGEGVFADIMGAGLSDVAVIGPKSVRFYPNTRTGFANSEIGDNTQLTHPLPIQGRNQRTLVAFSDVLGSGQSHLVEVDAQHVYCWPNTGRGQFGERLSLAWAGVAHFNPRRLYLVDIDGSGANDLIYAHANKLTLFYNHAGNGFAAGVDVPLPAGVQFDDTCQLSFADLQGSGGMSVLLSIPHITPAHWVLPLTPHKPYLMNGIDNQCGAVSEVLYRHSGQEWLDEKASNPEAQCHLPIPLYSVKTITNTDEITGNQLTHHFLYRQGVYDGIEREFRGFGYVETLDTQVLTGDVNPDTDAPPLKTCHWYHVGRSLPASVSDWPGDALAYSLGDTCFSQWQGGKDVPYTPSGADHWWALRALSGVLLREEIYGLDGSDKESIPYSVQSQRYRLRQCQVGITQVAAPVFMVLGLEQLAYHYERISTDPRCQQTVTLSYDEYGQALQQIGIDYPRRRTPTDALMAVSPYASADTEDNQQFTLRLNETLGAYLNNETAVYTIVGLSFESRQNVINALETDVPADGFSAESLQTSQLIDSTATRYFAGQQKTFYIGANDVAGFTCPPRIEHVETAVLDELALQAYDNVIATPQALAEELTQAGYIQVPRVLPISDDSDIWAAPQSFVRYANASGFYLPIATRATKLVGETLSTYDAYHLLVTMMEDAAGNQTTLAIDYQQLSAHTVIDINHNTRQTAVTALGYPVSASFYGEEGGADTGFAKLTDSTVPPLSVTELIAQAGQSIQSTATRSALDEFSWQAEVPLPLHQVTVVADQYPDIATQLQQVKVAYSDGFGRALQVTQKVEPGLAYQRDSAGELVLDDNGALVKASTAHRWAVSGRVEYNNKGQVVRQYPPYFVDDWQYIADTALRAKGHANTHYYDALGREVLVVTAKGYRRRSHYTPWFTVVEDENDTWHEIAA